MERTSHAKTWKNERDNGRRRPRKRWKEEVERDLQVLGVRRWRELAADRKKWKEIVRQPKPTVCCSANERRRRRRRRKRRRRGRRRRRRRRRKRRMTPNFVNTPYYSYNKPPRIFRFSPEFFLK